MAAGDFDGDNLEDVVAGVPRGNELVGAVSYHYFIMKNFFFFKNLS